MKLISYNTVYIGGTVSAGGSTTEAFNNQYNTNSRDFRNNVFLMHAAVGLANIMHIT
jgi:hypothetical protein